MPRDCALYLGDMMRSCESILEYTTGMTFVDYEANSLIRAAVERNFTIIGEALRQLSSSYPQFGTTFEDRVEIVAFRNRVIHAYFNVDDELVWSAVKVDVPALMRVLRPLMDLLR